LFEGEEGDAISEVPATEGEAAEQNTSEQTTEDFFEDGPSADDDIQFDNAEEEYTIEEVEVGTEDEDAIDLPFPEVE
ncbi:MAG: hypothetical protein IKC72_04260, partial [Clostridia bacterium]|nr:hypothetical protein [Clostridia bacterium]